MACLLLSDDDFVEGDVGVVGEVVSAERGGVSVVAAAAVSSSATTSGRVAATVSSSANKAGNRDRLLTGSTTNDLQDDTDKSSSKSFAEEFVMVIQG